MDLGRRDQVQAGNLIGACFIFQPEQVIASQSSSDDQRRLIMTVTKAPLKIRALLP
jgi:hypothetical protein